MGEGAFSALASAKPATLPGAPSQLVAAGGVGSIDLSWTAPASDGGDAVSSYAIYRGAVPASMAQIGTASSTSYRDTSLPPSTLYYYDVRAVNSVGQGPATSGSARTAGLPSSPSGPIGSASVTSVQLSWEAPGQDGGCSVIGYNVYRGLSITTMSLVATVTTLSFEDHDLSPGTTYYYSISAVNAVGEGASSAIDELATLVSVPSAPRNLDVQPGTKCIDLAWDAPSSDGGSAIVAYYVYRGSAHAQLTFLADTFLTAYSDQDVSLGQTYYYQVTALNSLGESTASSEASAKALAPPSAPIGLQGSKVKSSVGLSWGAPQSDGGASVTGYVIYRGTDPGSLSELTTVGAVLLYNDSSLPRANAAYYRVAAVNSAGEGAQSDIISVALTKKASPPRDLQASSQDGKLLLTWEAPEDDGGANITAYAIYRRSADGDFARVAEVNSTSLLDMGLANGVTYTYSIAAINTVGEGDLTGDVSGKPFGLPSSPPYLNATSYDQMVVLRWGSPSSDGGDAVIGYDVFVVDGSGERYLGQVAQGVNSYACNGLKNGVSYVFRVAAVNAAGESEKCSVVGTPKSAVLPPVGDAGSLELGSGVLIGSALGVLALVGMAVGVSRSKTLTKRQRSRHAASAKRDTAVRVQVAQPRMVRAATKPAPAVRARAEDAAFERTVRDLETANRIL